MIWLIFEAVEQNKMLFARIEQIACVSSTVPSWMSAIRLI
jgi:hypothetical protein